MFGPKLYNLSLFVSCVFIAGCGGGGGGGSGGISGGVSSSSLSADVNGETVYLRQTGANDQWDGADNWRKGVFDLGSNTIKGITNVDNASSASVVFLDGGLKAGTIHVVGPLNLAILDINNKDLTLSLDAAASKLEVKTLILTQGTIALSKGELWVEKATLDQGAVLEKATGDFRFKTAKDNVILIKGGKIDFDLDLPSAFSLSGYGIIGGKFTSRGTLLLSTGQTLKVRSFDKPSGNTEITLTSDKTMPLQSQSDVSLSGVLKISALKNAALGEYTLIQGSNPIVGDFSSVEFVNVEGNARIEGSAYKFTFNRFKTVPYISLNTDRLFENLASPGGDFKNYLNSPSFMYGAQKSSHDGLKFVSKQQDQKTSYALDFGGKIGAYGAFDDLNGFDAGVYGISSPFGMKWTNFAHMGHHVSMSKSSSLDAHNYFALFASQLSKTFGENGFKVAPRLGAGYQRIFGLEGKIIDHNRTFNLEIQKENAFFIEGGIDVSCDFSLKSIPFNAFAAFEVKNSTGHGLSLTQGNQTFQEKQGAYIEFSLGAKATFDSASGVYVNTSFAQDHEIFQFGVEAKI